MNKENFSFGFSNNIFRFIISDKDKLWESLSQVSMDFEVLDAQVLYAWPCNGCITMSCGADRIMKVQHESVL